MKIFYIMGKSASGKDYIRTNIYDDLKQHEFNVYLLPEYTSRQPRTSELLDKANHNIYQDKYICGANLITTQHVFVSDITFELLIKRDFFAEYRKIGLIDKIENNDNLSYRYWGTVKLSEHDMKSNTIYLGIGTPEAYYMMIPVYGPDIIPIWIDVDEETRKERFIKRELEDSNPKMKEIERRLKHENSWIVDPSAYNSFKNEELNDWKKILEFILVQLN